MRKMNLLFKKTRVGALCELAIFATRLACECVRTGSTLHTRVLNVETIEELAQENELP
jgi:hypothetical protein